MKDFPAYGKGNTGRLIRNAQTPQGGVSARIFILMLVLLAVALFFVVQRTEYLRTERRIRDLMLEQRRIQEEILPLKLEAEYLGRLELVQEMAVNRLHLIAPPTFRMVRPPQSEWTQEPEDEDALLDALDQEAPTSDAGAAPNEEAAAEGAQPPAGAAP